MNFKKYHVSKNMWDFEQWLTDRGATYTKDGNSYTFASQQAMYSTPFYFSQTNITISISGIIEAITATNPRVHLLKADGTRAKTDALTTAVSKYENVSCAGLIFDWSTPGNIKVSLPMLNSGSTSIPYEPYSSEVWHDIPYYQHKTATDTLTPPATLYPNDTSITVGVKGNTTQSGTPSQSQPSDVLGCGDRTENLTPNQKITSNTYSHIITTHSLINALKNITPNENYTLSWEFSSNGSGGVSNQIRLYTSASGTLIKILQQGVSFTLTSEEIANIGALFCYFGIGNTDGYMDKLMLVEGSTAPSTYIPYGYKIPISSANTTTPVYLGEVETTRKVKKLVLDGTENWSFAGAGTQYAKATLPLSSGGAAISSHFVYGSANTAGQFDFYGINVRFNTYGIADSVDEWKTYLQQQYVAGTPVTVWYVLATDTTAVVNEPLMKIGDYADEVSGITIPVTAGGDTLSVGTTVQPSEITANYKGWHPKTPKESNNGSWA